MDVDARKPDATDAGAMDLACVLVMVQAATALVTALGTAGVAVAFGGAVAMLMMALLTLGKTIFLVVLAAGLARLRGWARTTAVLYEGLALLSGLAGPLLVAVVGLTAPVESGFGLVALLTNVCLPAAIMLLLLAPSARAVAGGGRPARRAKVVDRRPQDYALAHADGDLRV